MDNKTFYDLARKHQGRINPYAALCQCNWETRTGGKPWNSELFLRANNAAGLKKWSGWAGPFYDKASWEQNADGTKVERVSSFCKYLSTREFLANYVKKIEADYPLCAERSESFWGYFAGLFKGRWGSWATDHSYFTRLCTVAIELAPEIFGGGWRNKLLDSLEYAVQQGYLTPEQQQTAIDLLRKQVSNINIEKDFAPQQRGLIICLDPGHGGIDPGASSGGVNEKDYTLIIAQEIGKELTRRGHDVHYTRLTDVYVSRPERAKIANNANADLFLSVHLNSFTHSGVQGHEDWVATKASETAVRLAGLIKTQWSRHLPKTAQRGVKRKDLDVLVLTKMPAVLDEIGFLSNPEERAQITDPAYHRVYATIISDAIDALIGG